MSSEAIEARILEVLKNAPEGMNQIGISQASGVSYASVVKWIKENPDKIKTESERKAKKVFSN